MVHGGGHLVDRGGGLFRLALLVEHALAHVAHAYRHALGAFVQACGGLRNDPDYTLVAGLHGIEGRGHLADFVTAVERHAGRQVAAFFYLQHHILEGVEMAQQEVDQQLRGGQQGQHQQGDNQRVTQRALGDHLRQAGRMGQYGEALALAQIDDLGADQAVMRRQRVLLHVYPAARPAQTGTLVVGQRRRLAIGKLQQLRSARQRLTHRPGTQESGLRLRGTLGRVDAYLLFELQGVQHQQQGGEEGHGVDGPEFVFEREVANPSAHRCLLLIAVKAVWQSATTVSRNCPAPVDLYQQDAPSMLTTDSVWTLTKALLVLREAVGVEYGAAVMQQAVQRCSRSVIVSTMLGRLKNCRAQALLCAARLSRLSLRCSATSLSTSVRKAGSLRPLFGFGRRLRGSRKGESVSSISRPAGISLTSGCRWVPRRSSQIQPVMPMCRSRSK